MADARKGKKESGLETLSDRLRNTLKCDEDKPDDKPDFRKLDLGSPVSGGLTATTATTTTSCSSISSGSFSSGNVCGSNLNPPKKTDSKPKDSKPKEDSRPKDSKPKSRSAESASKSASSQARKNKPSKTKAGSVASSPKSSTSSRSVTSPSPLLPTGNIYPSGIVVTTGMNNQSPRTEVMGFGNVNYGMGNIMRGGPSYKQSLLSGPSYKQSLDTSPNYKQGLDSAVSPPRRSMVGLKTSPLSENDPEELKRVGNDYYRRGHFTEALSHYNRAIAISPLNPGYHYNRSAALIGLNRLVEAVRECVETLRLEPNYLRAHQRLGSLYLSLGHIENARKHINHIYIPGVQPDCNEVHKLHMVERHMNKCAETRKVGDWKSTLREADAAIAAGADASPELSACRAEALLKLDQLDTAILAVPNLSSPSIRSQSKISGMLLEAYLYFVHAQIELAKGRFEMAVTAIERAGRIDPRSAEIVTLLKNMRLVSQARTRGNDLFKSERFSEACSAYGEGLQIDASNSVLYCNRAACWFKLGQWQRSVDDCNQALRIQPNYTKAILRRAVSNSKLERWRDAVRDYEVLRKELPDDNEIAESLFHAQVAWKKSCGEMIHNMKFGGEVESVSSVEQFRAAILSPGASVVLFKSVSNVECKQISSFLDALCTKYPSVSFLKVDIDEGRAIADAENVRIVPTFKIYKWGNKVKEMICPSPEVLETSVRHYSM